MRPRFLVLANRRKGRYQHEDVDAPGRLQRPQRNGTPLFCHFSDSIVRAAHLMPVFGSGFTPKHLTPALSLTTIFRGWYVNKYIDHHAFEIAF